MRTKIAVVLAIVAASVYAASRSAYLTYLPWQTGATGLVWIASSAETGALITVRREIKPRGVAVGMGITWLAYAASVASSIGFEASHLDAHAKEPSWWIMAVIYAAWSAVAWCAIGWWLRRLDIEPESTDDQPPPRSAGDSTDRG